MNISVDDYVSSAFRRQVLYASCWYNGEETLYMWDIYGRSDRMFAIQVCAEELIDYGFRSKEFFFESDFLNDNQFRLQTQTFKPASFHFGKVKYRNLNNDLNFEGCFIGQFKDQAFSHENEFRFLVKQNYQKTTQINLQDLKCSFNSEQLMKMKIKVILSPYADLSLLSSLEVLFYGYKNVSVEASVFTKLFK
jgi:hypothetical protein